VTTNDWPTLLYNILQLNSRECVHIRAVDSKILVDAGTVMRLVTSRGGHELAHNGTVISGVEPGLSIPLPLSRRPLRAR
jgi:hypothetical protein